MERKIRIVARGQLEEMGHPLLIRRALPNQAFSDVSPFLLLDHLQPVSIEPGSTKAGVPAHPHKGFITLTYMLKGTFEHADSFGNHVPISKGGIQWMMTGNGIVHEEMIGRDLAEKGGEVELLQLWINIPAANKRDTPYYIYLKKEEIPLVQEEGTESYVKVLVGSYKGNVSPIRTYSPLFVYHVHLAPSARIVLQDIPTNFNLFAYLPHQAVAFGSEAKCVEAGWTALLTHDGDELVIAQPNAEEAGDILLCGGQPILEPVVSRGPFVMNTMEEIQQAYREFQAGQFGRIT